MAFEIFPQSINVLPGDSQRFTMRADRVPILWKSISNGTFFPDGTIVPVSNTPGVNGVARTYQQASSSISGIKMIIGPNMIPSTGKFLLSLSAIGGAPTLNVHVFATSIELRDDVNALIGSAIVHSVVAGQIFEVTMASNVMRLIINGVVKGEYVAPNVTRYPLRGSVSWFPGFTLTPKIEALQLHMGDWKVIDEDDQSGEGNWTILGGTAADITLQNKIDYVAGVNPGVYLIRATVNSLTAQEASPAYAIIPPLSILGDLNIDALPAQKLTIPTNYDGASTKLVVWSVVSGGGSFANSEFTAPTTPGVTVVRATHNVQRAEARITVPVVLTASKSAAGPGEVINFSTNMTGTINWTADLGTASGSGAIFAWTAPNQTPLEAIITATNGTLTKSIKISILKIFPYPITIPIDFDFGKTAIINTAEDRSRTSRVKDKDGLGFESHALTFINRDASEVTAVFAFYQDCFPQKRFIYDDKVRNVRRVMYFDSKVSVKGDVTCSLDYSFRVVEAPS